VLLSIGMLVVPYTASAQAPSFLGEVSALDGTVYQVQATVTQVALSDNQLVAQTVNYTITNATTGETLSDTFAGALPLAANDGCGILYLDLQPIFLDLLGLQLQTSRIVLDLSAVAGQGKLLGNLLCVVLGLLDGPGDFIALINDIIDAFNSIIGGLG
jgi:hypothetical protein